MAVSFLAEKDPGAIVRVGTVVGVVVGEGRGLFAIAECWVVAVLGFGPKEVGEGFADEACAVGGAGGAEVVAGVGWGAGMATAASLNHTRLKGLETAVGVDFETTTLPHLIVAESTSVRRLEDRVEIT